MVAQVTLRTELVVQDALACPLLHAASVVGEHLNCNSIYYTNFHPFIPGFAFVCATLSTVESSCRGSAAGRATH